MTTNRTGGPWITADQEVRALPMQWRVTNTRPNQPMIFVLLHDSGKVLKTTYDHPVFGQLPRPWQLRRIGSQSYVYYNTITRETVQSGPRKIRLPAESFGEVSTVPLYHQYQRVHVLDSADGLRGGMNEGVYLVQSTKTKQLYAEKVFKSTTALCRILARSEIQMMRRLAHSSLVRCVEAYLREQQPFEGSVYMEFCNRGSLSDLIKAYALKKAAQQPDRIPESFIWQAFVSLADALGYLQTGQSYMSRSPQNNGGHGWVPIVHCDIKPSNILLRSRYSPGSNTFDVLLSDFGLMSYEQKNAFFVQSRSGTVEYHAPELCFDPDPEEHYKDVMAGPHSSKSDVWALAASMFEMCERDRMAHMNSSIGPLRSLRALGRMAKKRRLIITDFHFYSHYLERSIACAAYQDPMLRPDGWGLVVRIKALYSLWLEDPRFAAQVQENGELPPWATNSIKFGGTE